MTYRQIVLELIQYTYIFQNLMDNNFSGILMTKLQKKTKKKKRSWQTTIVIIMYDNCIEI